jgi:hypothetical protein
MIRPLGMTIDCHSVNIIIVAGIHMRYDTLAKACGVKRLKPQWELHTLDWLSNSFQYNKRLDHDTHAIERTTSANIKSSSSAHIKSELNRSHSNGHHDRLLDDYASPIERGDDVEAVAAVFADMPSLDGHGNNTDDKKSSSPSSSKVKSDDSKSPHRNRMISPIDATKMTQEEIARHNEILGILIVICTA